MPTVSLPWPPKILSPNARPHYLAKSAAVKKYRGICRMLARQYSPIFRDTKISVKVTFFPPDNRKRDKDNMIGSMKAAFDGIAEAWRIDDNRFVQTFDIGKAVRHGEVVMEFTV